MAQTEHKIKEIVCLKSKVASTGRFRILKPGDMEGDQWEKLVEAAESSPKNFEIHRDLVVTEAESAKDIEDISLKQMYGMAREKVAAIGEHYGIRDNGQGRNALIDQISAEREAQEKTKKKLGIGAD